MWKKPPLWATSHARQPLPCSQLTYATPHLTLGQKYLFQGIRLASAASWSLVPVLPSDSPITHAHGLHPSVDASCMLNLVGESSSILSSLMLQIFPSGTSLELEVLPQAHLPPIRRKQWLWNHCMKPHTPLVFLALPEAKWKGGIVPRFFTFSPVSPQNNNCSVEL